VVLTVTAGTAESAPPDTGGLPALRLAVAAGGGALPGSDAVVADPEGASPAATGCREGGGCRRPPRRRDASARGGGYVPWVGSRRSHTP
jgi:hypothetical protein